MLDNVKDLDRSILPREAAVRLSLFLDDQVDVNVGVDEVPVGGPSDCSVYAHQTMLLRALKHCSRLQGLMTRLRSIRLDPANIFATPEAPSTQTLFTEGVYSVCV